MNGWSGIALAFYSPFAFVVGGILALFGYVAVKAAPDGKEHEWLNTYRVNGTSKNGRFVTNLICAQNRADASEHARRNLEYISIVEIKLVELDEKCPFDDDSESSSFRSFSAKIGDTKKQNAYARKKNADKEVLLNSIQAAIDSGTLRGPADQYLVESKKSMLPGKVTVVINGDRVAVIPLLD